MLANVGKEISPMRIILSTGIEDAGLLRDIQKFLIATLRGVFVELEQQITVERGLL